MKKIKRILSWLCRPVTQWFQVDEKGELLPPHELNRPRVHDWLHILVAIVFMPLIVTLFFVVLVYLLVRGRPVCEDDLPADQPLNAVPCLPTKK